MCDVVLFTFTLCYSRPATLAALAAADDDDANDDEKAASITTPASLVVQPE